MRFPAGVKIIRSCRSLDVEVVFVIALHRVLCGERKVRMSFSPHSRVELDSRWLRSQLSIFWVFCSFGSSSLTTLACLSLSFLSLFISLGISSPELIIDDVLSIEAMLTG